MNATTNKHAGMRLGRMLGRAYLRAKQQRAAFRGWLIRIGCSQRIAGAVTALLTIVAIGIAAYIMIWLLVPVLIVCIIAAGVGRSSAQTEWHFEQHSDHRKNTFYDPNAYTDDPDPRWEPPN